jgi:3-deoxy-D-manno-octulosonic-acid transferase
MRLWIVPRHPQRFDEVVALVAASGLRVDRRSRWRKGLPDALALAADVWVGDSLGEMPAYYAAAHVACLGGSFEPLGGQNLIEAAACACPLVMGPSTFNFADAAVGSEAAGAAWRVSDWPAALALIDGLSLEARQAAAQRAQAFAAAHRGATQATVEALKAWLTDAADSGH